MLDCDSYEWHEPGTKSEIPLPVLLLGLGVDRGAFVQDTYRRLEIVRTAQSPPTLNTHRFPREVWLGRYSC